jgi:rhodanese-related sulfurtransferase
LGYANVKNLSGGFAGWRTAQLPVAKGAPVAPAAGKPPEVDRHTLAMLDKYLNGQAQQKWNGIAPASLKDGIAAVNPFLVDVREPSELAGTGIIEGSVNIPLRTLIKNLDELPNDKSAPTVVYCAIGHRGAMAMMTLHLLGRTNVKSLSGGLTAWKAANLPTVKAS